MDEISIFIQDQIESGNLESVRPCRNYRKCYSVYFGGHTFGWIYYDKLTNFHLEMLEKSDKMCNNCKIIEEQWFGGI